MACLKSVAGLLPRMHAARQPFIAGDRVIRPQILHRCFEVRILEMESQMPRQVRLAQRGYSSPARRLIAIAWTARSITAASMINKYKGLVTIPREMISVVAPAGGWGALRRIIKAPVAERESAA